METILQSPQWPASFSNFVTYCLMWDPKNRPTSKQALSHEYFTDAVDPLRPKSSTARLLGRKHSDLSFKPARETNEGATFSTKPSWFRRSLIARDSAPAVPQHDPNAKLTQTPPMHGPDPSTQKSRPVINKRSTWANGAAPVIGAPMPILPSIRPISPLSNAVTAQASGRLLRTGDAGVQGMRKGRDEKVTKIGRQLSLNSHGNHYADHQLEGGSNASRGPRSPLSAHKESFFSHLRKRARRFSGRNGVPSPHADDLEANAANGPWVNRSSIAVDNMCSDLGPDAGFTDLDKALQSVRYSLERPAHDARALPVVPSQPPSLQRQHSLPKAKTVRTIETNTNATPIFSRTRRALQMTTHPVHRYETPEEEDELLDEVLTTTNAAAARLAQHSGTEEKKPRPAMVQKVTRSQSVAKIQMAGDGAVSSGYPTPSPSAKRNGVLFGKSSTTPSQPVDIVKQRSEMEQVDSQWPTPPYEENEWGAAAAASIFAAGMVYR